MSHLCRIVKKEEIPLWKRILIRLLGEYPAFKADPYGLGNIEYYYSYCKEHGCYYIDYRHGYRQETRCPKCVDEKYFRDEILPLA
jgi:hypothetical protein